MFHIKVARSAAEVETLGSVWDSLMISELSLFQTHRWNHLAAQVFARREEPYFIFAEDDNGAAILPAVLRAQSGTIGFAGECLFDYRDYLAAGDPAPLAAAWRKLASLGLPLSITAVCRSECDIWKALPKVLFSRAPRLTSAGTTAEQFAQDHSRAFARLRKLERMGFGIRQYLGDSPLVGYIYRRRSTQLAESDLFRDPWRVEFMVTACRKEGAGCEVFTLEDGSSVAAALVTFRDSGWRRFYTTFYDRQWARFSPGMSLLFEVARRSLEQGMGVDLMTGEQDYKIRIAQSTQDLFAVNTSAVEMGELFPCSASRDWAA